MLKRLVLRRPSYVGLAFGVVLLGLSLTPSLLPRTWLFQGVVSGLALALGYGLGALISHTWSYLELPRLEGNRRVLAARIAIGVGVVYLGYFLVRTGTWQNRVRELVGEPPSSATHPVRILLVAALLAGVLIVVARVIGGVTRRTIRWFQRFVPERLGRVVGVAVIVVLAVTLVTGVMRSVALDVANSAFSVPDGRTDPEAIEPTSPLRSGSPESLSPWDELGRQGRKFVGTGPSIEDLALVAADPMEPIRAYVGLKTSDSVEERAQLALDELLRTDAFERDVMVIATSTGTGWLDPNAVDTLEYMYGGNTAIVSLQYSYLPSWLALLADTESAKEGARALFDAVHGHWRTLDEDDRPELYLYGLSLGAYGSQTSASRVNLVNDPVDGALWVGPPFVSEFWNQITDDRDEGSPAWRPIYEDGEVIRFTNEVGDLDLPDGQWEDNRFVYLQYPTDPVVFFDPDALLSEPDWLKEERGQGVSDDFDFIPFVTFLQLAVDLPQAGSVPHGYAHNYSVESYVDSWIAVTEPDGWTDEDTTAVVERVSGE